MKFTKRSVSLIALVLGVAVFTGAALADLIIGSGYQQLKDSVKTTSHYLAVMTNYTVDMDVELKLDDKVLLTAVNTEYIDLDNGMKMSYHREGEVNNLALADMDMTWSEYTSISNLNTSERLYWSHYGQNSVEDMAYYLEHNAYIYNGSSLRSDPFEEPMMADLEKVFDALVGNLSSLVQVSSEGDGKEFTGSLNEAQVPVLIQAITSYAFKEMSGAYTADPEQDLYNVLPFQQEVKIDSVNGRALTDSEGRLRHVVFDASIAGTDRQGQNHTLSMTMTMRLDEIGTTYLSWPSLDGKNVIESDNQYGLKGDPMQIMPEREAGLYTADIVYDNGETYIKIGERWLELDVNSTEVHGHYWETFLPDYEDLDSNSVGSITFVTGNGWRYEDQLQASSFTEETSVGALVSTGITGDGVFTAVDSQGRERQGYLDLWGNAASMYLHVDPLNDTLSINRLPMQRVFD